MFTLVWKWLCFETSGKVCFILEVFCENWKKLRTLLIIKNIDKYMYLVSAFLRNKLKTRSGLLTPYWTPSQLLVFIRNPILTLLTWCFVLSGFAILTAQYGSAVPVSQGFCPPPPPWSRPPEAKSLGISPSQRAPLPGCRPPPLPTTRFREYSCI